ncbi:hypothetical protein GN712_17300 [Vibrio cholerae]|uniref:hypothetical protein n=1 Tax=Vibrio cholerae TaxID=666 RepID=UPI000374D4D9|nr:hypothetical protein [Vibrio cholerae]EGQ7979766.1 hypothetical protein [Vibrio cholerae]EGQ8531406.1 hypothetical protein [Vibrio cholerae]EGQ8559181.1 hypothetical protein [Vibrio cholerae]RNE84471.1 hypothetical protein EEJ38_17060 [Vibrio cholerae]
MAETTTNGSNTTLDLTQSFALLSVDKNGIVTMKFGDEVMVFMNDKGVVDQISLRINYAIYD